MSVKIRYLYLDDEQRESVSPYIDILKRSNKNIDIDHQQPKKFSEQVKEIKNKKYDGLILDLRLDEVKVAGHEGADYRALPLAQEIRTRANEGAMREFPIVLWSTSRKMRKSFSKDILGHELYDAEYIKEEIPDRSDDIANQLLDLVKGYTAIRDSLGSSNAAFKLLSLHENIYENLDPAIKQYLANRHSVHEIARFLLNELIKVPGPLIDEDILAARLGVDINKSSDWNELKATVLKVASYKGPFGIGWPRWWGFLIENWWKSKKDNPGSLRRMLAEDRVKYLKKITKLKNLTHVKPISKEYSHVFWTVCMGHNKPLDPIDGLIVSNSENKKTWQDSSYVSIDAALKRKNINNWIEISAREKERFADIKRLMTHAKK